MPSTYLEPAVAATGEADGAGLFMTLRASDGNMYSTRSADAGTSWTTPTPLGAADDTKTCLWAFGGATSGLLLSYNELGSGRARLLLSVSYDAGATFSQLAVLEDGTDKLAHCYPTTITNGTHALTGYSEYVAVCRIAARQGVCCCCCCCCWLYLLACVARVTFCAMHSCIPTPKQTHLRAGTTTPRLPGESE